MRNIPAAWIFSDKRGFSKSWAAYCNRRDSGLKKIYIGKNAIFTVIPTGEVIEKKMSTARTANYTRADRTAIGHEVEVRYIAELLV